jgi:hypothetical protein
LGQVPDEYAELCGGATITDGFAVHGEEAREARPDVEVWLRHG